MNGTANACPHCGATHCRQLRDQWGAVGWCGICHRTWVAEPLRRSPPERPDRAEDGLRRRVA